MLQLAWTLVIVAAVLVACAAGFMIFALCSVNKAIRAMAETCSEAMDNVVAACDLPTAIYVKEQRELKKAQDALRKAPKPKTVPVERSYVK